MQCVEAMRPSKEMSKQEVIFGNTMKPSVGGIQLSQALFHPLTVWHFFRSLRGSTCPSCIDGLTLHTGALITDHTGAVFTSN